MIQLTPENEHLRDSLFYCIYRNAILFDDLVSAISYRKSLVDQGRRAPSLYTVTGDRVQSDGVLNPKPNNKLPANLKSVFGQLPQAGAAEIQKLDAGNA